MADHWYEIEVRARDARGQESVVHAEYNAQSETPREAASEVFEAVRKEHGKARARFVDDGS